MSYRTSICAAAICLSVCGGSKLIAEESASASPIAYATVRGMRVAVRANETGLIVRVGEKENAVRIPSVIRLSASSKVPPTSEFARVTEIQATPWMDGLAVAIEAVDVNGARRYRWATMFIDVETSSVALVASQVFLLPNEDFDLASIRNPTGDSIFVLLSRYDRESSQLVSVVAFTHDCPVYPTGGTLRRLYETPVDAGDESAPDSDGR